MFARKSSAASRHLQVVPTVPGGTISGNRLQHKVGQRLQLLAPTPDGALPLLQGNFTLTRLRQGLTLHCTDVMHLSDMSTQVLVDQACTKVLLRLEGNAQVEVGRRNLPLDAGLGRHAVPHAALVTLCRPETLRRLSRAGTRQRMVVLTMHPDWLVEAGFTHHPLGEHLAVKTWQPSRRAIALAEQLLHPIGPDSPLQRLLQESRVLELITEAFGHVQDDSLQRLSPNLPTSAEKRVRRLQSLICSGEADELDMSEMARQMGCNASTLQQQFRAVVGQSIFDYLREQRLQRAADALQREGIPVARAAEIAGYSSQANFSTAFKRRYGVPPKYYRNRI